MSSLTFNAYTISNRRQCNEKTPSSITSGPNTRRDEDQKMSDKAPSSSPSTCLFSLFLLGQSQKTVTQWTPVECSQILLARAVLLLVNDVTTRSKQLGGKRKSEDNRCCLSLHVFWSYLP